jgi:FixJ family two-component response regulator
MPDAAYVHIIDDDGGLRESLESLVRSVGYEVRLFGSVAAFLKSELPDAPSCLLLDIRLPGANGLDFQASLHGRGIFMPVILMTGFGDIEMSVRAMKAGALDFLTKPFRQQDVLHAVGTALNKDRDRRNASDEVAAIQRRFDSLTRRERQVIHLVIAGKMNKQTAAELGLSEITVKIHRGAAMKKMQTKSLPDLVRMDETVRVVDQLGPRSLIAKRS